jgi:4-hydroxy-tetrahydrodipicolinate synthase
VSLKPEKLKEILRKGAVLTVQLTPFKKNGELDYEGLKANTRFLVEKRHYGPMVLVPTGSTGEHYTLTDEERMKALRTVVEEAGGKMPIIAGAGHSGTIPAAKISKAAQEIGADGVMIVLPYYHVPEEEGMYLHYKTISDAIDIGILVYNNPDVSKVYIKPHLMKRIANLPNVVGVKENTPFLPTFWDQVKAVGDRIPILQGRGEWWFVLSAMLGARGYISGYANFMPEFCIDLLRAGLQMDVKKLNELFMKLDSYEEFVAKMIAKYGPSTTILPYPYVSSYMVYGVMKASMDFVGLHGEHMRLPLLDIGDEDKPELEKILAQKLGLRKV